MYSFLVDFVNFMNTGQVRYFLIFFAIIWLRWFIVNSVAATYKPFNGSYRTTKSVVIPVVDEEPALFETVLRSIKRERPQQIIVIINGPKNRSLEAVCKKVGGIEYHWTRTPGKRNALRVGMKYVTGDISVLVDSDTIWTKHTLSELMKPFADATIGGVTTRQRITDPTARMLSRFCDWLEDVRALGTLQAMSVTGFVGCLPGRTIAFRTDIIHRVMKQFMHEEFLGFHKEVSDDRSLTNLTLRAGYKTVLQSTSVVYTEAPTSWKVFIRQQLRWSEGSQYNNVKMSGWMFKHAQLMFFIYWTDTLLPFMLWAMYGSYIINLIFLRQPYMADTLIGTQSMLIVMSATLIGAYISYSIRQLHVIGGRPVHLLYIPLYILLLSFVMAPIRMIGFAKLADDLGWGTRKSAYVGLNRQFKLPSFAMGMLRLRHVE
jgi:cellobiuronic acid synthase